MLNISWWTEIMNEMYFMAHSVDNRSINTKQGDYFLPFSSPVTKTASFGHQGTQFKIGNEEKYWEPNMGEIKEEIMKLSYWLVLLFTGYSIGLLLVLQK